MDYHKLIVKLNETSRRVKQLEEVVNSIEEQVEEGNMDLIVAKIVKEAIENINSLYDINVDNNNGTLKGEL